MISELLSELERYREKDDWLLEIFKDIEKEGKEKVLELVDLCEKKVRRRYWDPFWEKKIKKTSSAFLDDFLKKLKGGYNFWRDFLLVHWVFWSGSFCTYVSLKKFFWINLYYIVWKHVSMVKIIHGSLYHRTWNYICFDLI